MYVVGVGLYDGRCEWIVWKYGEGRYTGTFEVPSENEDVSRLLCRRGLCVCNTNFKHNNVHNHTRMVRSRVLSMIDFVLV